MKHFITSDLHFYHGNIMRYCRRIAWMTPEEIKLLDQGVDFLVSDDSINRMNDALIFNVNQVVHPDDVLWILGDWCFGSRRFPDRLPVLRSRIQCKTCFLVFGNHDIRKIVAPFFSASFEKITIAIAVDGRYWIGEDELNENKEARKARKLVLDHYPNASWNGSGKGWWMLHGHCHGNITSWTNEHMKGAKILDVGVDSHDYKPWSFDEIKTYMDKRCGFAADHHKQKE